MGRHAWNAAVDGLDAAPRPCVTRHTPSSLQKMEPKTYFANERTLLAWLHMAVTIGSIAAALLGYSGATQSTTHPEDVRHGVFCARCLLWLLGCGGGGRGPRKQTRPVRRNCLRLPARRCKVLAGRLTCRGTPAARLEFPYPSPHPLPQQAPESVQLIAIILLPVGILMCAYSLMVYLWRTDQISSKSLSYIDDRRWAVAVAGLRQAGTGVPQHAALP